jgi:hypothetical protein
MTEITKAPELSGDDFAYAIVKGAISSIPFPLASGVAAEVLSLIIAPPLAKRQEAWVSSIAQGLVDLQEKVEGLKLEDLSNNGTFITMTLQATQVALRNHQEEKLEALRNAVVNSAMPSAPDDDLQSMFLNIVDAMTPWHLRILKFFDEPRELVGRSILQMEITGVMAEPADVAIMMVFPKLNGRMEFIDKIIRDLEAHGLAQVNPKALMLHGFMDRGTSELGRQFLRYISEPTL